MPSDQPLQPVISLGRLEPAKSAGSPLPSRALQPALPPSADWRRYLVAIRRYKWIVLAGSLLGGGAGFAAGRYLGSEYTARATIWIDVPRAVEYMVGAIESRKRTYTYPWQMKLLKEVMARVPESVIRRLAPPPRTSSSS